MAFVVFVCGCVFGCWWSVDCYKLSVVCCVLLFVVRCAMFVARCVLLVDNCLLFVGVERVLCVVCAAFVVVVLFVAC